MSGIIIVDDDANIRELVRAQLANNGFEVIEASDGADAMRKISGRTPPDLAVIDVMMPDMDGFELCERLRRDYDDMPILMLTALGEVSHKVRGLGLGADDYLTKPFEGSELVARARALLRRYMAEASRVIQVGGLTLDKNSYCVEFNGRREDIPMKEFELLFRLAGCSGRTMSRNRLIEDVWGIDFEGNERTLDVHIGRLRERFPAERYGFRITTIRGLGYRLEVSS
ncbi:MAG: response regulator transcription factor [Synergistaceae bacterium]|jgi:DNA-binding response OmpR family regulator|nr:response regulator transcription factor [Synergistaceae bacterium]